jgi:hypothetical protein
VVCRFDRAVGHHAENKFIFKEAHNTYSEDALGNCSVSIVDGIDNYEEPALNFTISIQ